MKKLIMTLAILLLTSQAHAQSLFDIPYTGISSWKNDVLGWIPERGYGGMGGGVARNNMGSAFQFTLINPMNINYLSVNAVMSGTEWTYNGETSVSNSWDYKLYTETAAHPRYTRGDNGFDGQTPSNQIPDLNSLFATSRIELSNSDYGDKQITDYRVPFNANLEPGTYWISHENDYSGGGALTSGISQRFGTFDINSVTTPEPTSLLLFGMGLFGFLKIKLIR